ncbi:MAG: sulfite exporter TauE/SafE family protein [Candidatus Omnitrophota bacterium]
MNAGFLLIGLVSGICGGFFGIGGAVITIPSLIFLFKFSQHQAQGTTLAAMIPPIGLLAAWNYYNQGHVKILPAVLIALGFFCGGYIGSLLVMCVSPLMLKKLFGVFLFLISLKLIFFK